MESPGGVSWFCLARSSTVLPTAFMRGEERENQRSSFKGAAQRLSQTPAKGILETKKPCCHMKSKRLLPRPV